MATGLEKRKLDSKLLNSDLKIDLVLQGLGKYMQFTPDPYNKHV